MDLTEHSIVRKVDQDRTGEGRLPLRPLSLSLSRSSLRRCLSPSHSLLSFRKDTFRSDTMTNMVSISLGALGGQLRRQRPIIADVGESRKERSIISVDLNLPAQKTTPIFRKVSSLSSSPTPSSITSTSLSLSSSGASASCTTGFHLPAAATRDGRIGSKVVSDEEGVRCSSPDDEWGGEDSDANAERFFLRFFIFLKSVYLAQLQLLRAEEKQLALISSTSGGFRYEKEASHI
ncbi:hypothetical protein ACLOJK_000709 [Asimina triloba]